MKRKLTRHHIIPVSRGGKTLENNLSYVPKKPHEYYHNLFINKTPDEIIEYLVNNFWRGQTKWIDLYMERYK